MPWRDRLAPDEDRRPQRVRERAPCVRPGGSRRWRSSSCRERLPSRKIRIISTMPTPPATVAIVFFLSSTLPWTSPWNACSLSRRSSGVIFEGGGGLRGHVDAPCHLGSLLRVDFLTRMSVIASRISVDHQHDQVRQPTTDEPVARRSNSVCSRRSRPSRRSISPRPSARRRRRRSRASDRRP